MSSRNNSTTSTHRPKSAVCGTRQSKSSKCKKNVTWNSSTRPASAVRKNTSTTLGIEPTGASSSKTKRSTRPKSAQPRSRDLGNLNYFLDDSNFAPRKKHDSNDETVVSNEATDRSSTRQPVVEINKSCKDLRNASLRRLSSVSSMHRRSSRSLSHIDNPEKSDRALRSISYTFSRPSSEIPSDDAKLRATDCWKTLDSIHIYPYYRKFSILNEDPISPHVSDDYTGINPTPPRNILTYTRNREPDIDEDEVEDKCVAREGFRKRYAEVYDHIQREATMGRPPPAVDHIKGSGKTYNIFDDDSMDSLQDMSPREALIREIVSRNQIPFVVREILMDQEAEEVTSIDVEGQGLGDSKMCCLVRCLPYFSNVVSINIAGNRLTDVSIQPFLHTVLQQLHCTMLDISDNKIDSMSIDILKADLKANDCVLRELRLRKSDIDDTECEEMMQSVIANKSLTSINLSENQIGTKEDLNAANPSFTTGAEAIAEMLLQNRVLTELDISWNSIRGESAIALGQSVSQNNTLRILNLAYNNFSDEGAQQLAHSLRFNVSLTDVDISYNNLSSKTALVFGQVLSTNPSMYRLNFNGNCAGRIGTRALIRAVRMAASERRVLKVILDKANTTYEDDTFDRSNPSGKYVLDVGNTYGYTVACILYELANTKPDAKFVSIKHGVRKPNISSDQSNVMNDYTWREVKLVRGPSASEASKVKWAATLKDLETVMLPKSPTKRFGSRPSSTRSRSKANFSATPTNRSTPATEKYDSKLRDAVVTVCKNFDMHPDDDTLDALCEHISSIPNDNKKELSIVLKEIFIKVFQMVWKNSEEHKTNIEAAQRSSSLKRMLSFTEDDKVMHVGDVAKAIKLLGWNGAEVESRQYALAFSLVKCADVFNEMTITRADFVRHMFLNFTMSYASPPGPLIDDKTGCPWEVPTSGILAVTFHCTGMPPSQDALVSEEAIETMTNSCAGNLSPPSTNTPTRTPKGKVMDSKVDTLGVNFLRHRRSLKQTSDAQAQIDRAILKESVSDEDFVVTCDQAESLLVQFLKDNETPITHIMETILPQIATCKDACRFLAKNLTFEQILNTRDRMQNFFRAITGVSTGHYSLDLSKKMDRLAAKRLSEQCNLERSKRASWTVAYLNTSQSGHNDAFRNASYNSKPFVLTSSWFESLPENGKLRFDFVNMERPVPGLECVSDHTFNRLMRMFLFTDEVTGEVGRDINQAENECTDNAAVSGEHSRKNTRVVKRDELSQFLQALKDSNSNSIKRKSQREASKVYWQSILQSTETKFYESHTQFLLDKIKEAKQAIIVRKGLKQSTKTTGGPVKSIDDYIVDPEKAGEGDKGKGMSLQEQNETKNLHQLALYSLIYREARARPVYLAEVFFSVVPAKQAKPGLRRSSNLIADSKTQNIIDQCLLFYENLRALEVLLVYQVYFSVAQVEKILDRFRSRGAPNSVLVACLQMVFSRIVDLDCLPQLVNSFPSSLKQEVMHRLGVLNVWCPMHPDGVYKFDLASWDQREAAKILFRLAVLEPGDNLLSEIYYPSSAEEEIPGWVLPLNWTTEGCAAEAIATQGIEQYLRLAEEEESKLPRHGIVMIEYTSDPEKGCTKNEVERLAMSTTRTLAYYYGRFIENAGTSKKNKAKVIPQSAVKFVGPKLRKMTKHLQTKMSFTRELSRLVSHKDITEDDKNENEEKYNVPILALRPRNARVVTPIAQDL